MAEGRELPRQQPVYGKDLRLARVSAGQYGKRKAQQNETSCGAATVKEPELSSVKNEQRRSLRWAGIADLI